MTSSPPNPTSKIRVDIKSFHVVRFAGGDVRRTEGALHPPIPQADSWLLFKIFIMDFPLFYLSLVREISSSNFRFNSCDVKLGNSFFKRPRIIPTASSRASSITRIRFGAGKLTSKRNCTMSTECERNILFCIFLDGLFLLQEIFGLNPSLFQYCT